MSQEVDSGSEKTRELQRSLLLPEAEADIKPSSIQKPDIQVDFNIVKVILTIN